MGVGLGPFRLAFGLMIILKSSMSFGCLCSQGKMVSIWPVEDGSACAVTVCVMATGCDAACCIRLSHMKTSRLFKQYRGSSTTMK